MNTEQQQQHFVTFMAPGAVIAETLSEPIDEWDPGTAVDMASDVVERLGAKPYGFYFSTRDESAVGPADKTIAVSNKYYLGGTILTVEEVEERFNVRPIFPAKSGRDRKDPVVVTNSEPRWFQFYRDTDVILDVESV